MTIFSVKNISAGSLMASCTTRAGPPMAMGFRVHAAKSARRLKEGFGREGRKVRGTADKVGCAVTVAGIGVWPLHVGRSGNERTVP